MTSSLTTRRGLLQSSLLLATGGIAGLPRSGLAEEPSPQPANSEHRIASVRTFLLKHKLARPFGVSVSVPLDKTRSTLLVKIETNSGLVGWGETSPIGGARGTIDDHLAPRLMGQNPLQHRQLWRMMWGSNFGNALAVGALDMALLDLRGKILNLSVAEMYGGRLRDRVPAYASAMNYVEGAEPEKHFPAEAVALVEQGFTALKMRLGRYPVAREAAVAKAVRKAVGPEIRLMADGNGAYTLNTALAMGDELHKLGFDFFEEPLPQSPNYAGYEELRQKLPLPLAAGEVVDSRANAKLLIDRRALDIIQPDVSLCGGMGEALFIAELAALAGIPCIPHCWGSAILIAATVQLLSLLPDPHWGLPTDSPLLEFDQSENPWRTELTGKGFQLREGYVDVPQTPGLGIEVDQRAVDKFAV